MNISPQTYKPIKAGQRGVAAVEFALVAIPFFLLLLGVIEFGRLMYVWTTVQEVTRSAARQLVVTDFKNATAISAIKYSAVFRLSTGSLPAAPEITDDSIKIRYLNINGDVATPLPAGPSANISACLANAVNCIRFVEVCISTDSACSSSGGIPFSPLISFFSALSALKIPLSTVRMPAESLGFLPG